MSALPPDAVARIAQLARLALSSEEVGLFSAQLTRILDYVEQLRALDTQDVPTTSHPLALTAPMRDDEVRPSLPRDVAIAGAPESAQAAGLFKVPRVLGA